MKILCMSKSKSEFAAKLDEHGEIVADHIIKLLLYPNVDAANHWRGEVWAQLHKIPLLKRTNKLPSVKFIMDNTYRTSILHLDRRIQCIIDENTEYTATYTDSDLHKIDSALRDYFTWLAEELHSNQFVTKQQVYAKLNSLIDNYT